VVKKKSEYDKAQAEANKSAAASAAKTTPADAKDAGKDKDAAKGGDKDKDKSKDAADSLVAQQTFVTTNGTRGDQISITKGLDEGAEVITSGQVKLKNGAPITIDNTVQPANSPNPTPQEH
jgi:membrane fusion protein (multidrug efflux system)